MFYRSLMISLTALFLLVGNLKADTFRTDCNDLYGCKPSYSNSKPTESKSSPLGQPLGQKGTAHSSSSKPKPSPSSASAPSSLNAGKKNFLHSVVFITALFDNGVQKQGYGLLIQDGYILGLADLVREEGSYLRRVEAKIQDGSSNSLMCFAMLRLRATDSRLSLLRAENYTDIYCNKRPESFYHQWINLNQWIPIGQKTPPPSKINQVLFPFIAESNVLTYKKSSLKALGKVESSGGLPLFDSKGAFLGFLSKDSKDAKNASSLISSREAHDFICDVAKRRLLPTSDLIRPCLASNASASR